MQSRPLQHAVWSHGDPSLTHRPATPAGPLLQSGYCAAAGPVQKHDAWSYVMQTYARQYGVSTEKPGGLLMSTSGVQTLPSSWHIALSPQPSPSHRSPTPSHSSGRDQLSGTEVITTATSEPRSTSTSKARSRTPASP